MRDVKRAVLIAIGLAVVLPVVVVIAFEAGPVGFGVVGALFVLAFLLVVYSDVAASPRTDD